MTITAEIILDSISQSGHRLTTLRCRYPKFIHGEFMTHRLFSRNASSSRAVPVSKNLEEVRSDALRAAPVWWGREQKGMQSGEELDDIERHQYGVDPTPYSRREVAQLLWREAANNAAIKATQLAEAGVHKSIVNRVLEPFLHINVLVSATEWDNFFGLRLDRAAQPEMRRLAEEIYKAREASAPQRLEPGWWHLPFVDMGEIAAARESAASDDPQLALKVSVARCARISYESFETGRRSIIAEDLRLYERLVGAQPIHASPAEHQATPDEWNEIQYDIGWANRHQHGNFVGWRQFRKLLPREAVAPLPEEYRK